MKHMMSKGFTALCILLLCALCIAPAYAAPSYEVDVEIRYPWSKEEIRRSTEDDVIHCMKQGDYTYQLLEDGTISIVGIDNQSKHVVIPDTIDGYVVTAIGSPDGGVGPTPIAETMQSITYPDTLTRLYFYSFASGLKTIPLPASLKVIEDLGFANNDGLNKITLPDGLESIGWCAFSNSRLKKVTIPGSVRHIEDNAFERSAWLKSVTLEDGIPYLSKEMFLECTALTKITLPSSVESLGEKVFFNCTKLSAVTFKDCAIPVIPASAFSGCDVLSKINLPATLTAIDKEAFYGCKKLAKLTLPEGLLEIGDSAFGGCSKLSQVTLPASLTRIGDYVFDGCSPKITFTVMEGSYAEQWATENGMRTKVLKQKK